MADLSFLGLALECPEYCRLENSSYYLLPVAYDGTSTWQKGADKGPEALLLASSQVELFDVETRCEPFRAGIYTGPWEGYFTSPKQMVLAVQKRVAEILALQKVPIIIGGEHSVTIGAVYAVTEFFKDLTVVQLDAHADLRNEYQGSAFNHACVMARVKEKCPVVQVGIRSAEGTEFLKADPERIFQAQDICGKSDWMARVLELCNSHIYLTIDVDVFDPAFMPSTGTPEPGGLSWYEVLSLLRLLCSQRQLVGFDIVELCPNGQPHAEFLAAKLVYKIIGYRQIGLQTLSQAKHYLPERDR